MVLSSNFSRLHQLADEHLRFRVNQTDSADTIEIYKEQLYKRGHTEDELFFQNYMFEVENALHHNELPSVNYTYVTIYERQMGIGGDDSWGAMVHDEFLLDSSIDHELNFVISR